RRFDPPVTRDQRPARLDAARHLDRRPEPATVAVEHAGRVEELAPRNGEAGRAGPADRDRVVDPSASYVESEDDRERASAIEAKAKRRPDPESGVTGQDVSGVLRAE